MKVTIEMDCTPAEARQFLGLPDVEPLQKKVMAEVERRTLAEMERFSPDTFLRNWLSSASVNAGQLQEAFSRLFQPNSGMEQRPEKRSRKK